MSFRFSPALALTRLADAKLALKIVLGALVVAGSFFATLWILETVAEWRTVEPYPSWDEKLYLTLYPDVAEHVRSGGVNYKTGYEHYVVYGKIKGLPSGYIPGNWNEAAYLQANPDVAELVKKGQYISGYHQYLTGGCQAGRKGGLPNGK